MLRNSEEFYKTSDLKKYTKWNFQFNKNLCPNNFDFLKNTALLTPKTSQGFRYNGREVIDTEHSLIDYFTEKIDNINSSQHDDALYTNENCFEYQQQQLAQKNKRNQEIENDDEEEELDMELPKPQPQPNLRLEDSQKTATFTNYNEQTFTPEGLLNSQSGHNILTDSLRSIGANASQYSFSSSPFAPALKRNIPRPDQFACKFH